MKEQQNISKLDKKFCVYKHTSPSGKCYIGITTYSVKRRWKNGKGYPNNPYFTGAIKKYGWKNITHEILYTNISEIEAKTIEKNLIRYYKNNGLSYNITDGGDGHLGCSWIPSEETKKLWSQQRKGRRLTEEWKQNLSKATKGRKLRRDIIEMGVKASNKVLSKPVIQYSLDNKIIQEWPSIRKAAEAIGIKSPRDIIRCCIGERKTRAGFKWKYKEGYFYEGTQEHLKTR